MKKLTLPVFLFILFSVSVQAQKFDVGNLFPIDKGHSYVEFVATYMGYAKVRGNFGNFYGSIYYDPNNVNQTSVSFQIDVESINTNHDWRDKDLKSENWFGAEKFPHIKFISSKVQKEGEGLKVTGELTVKETTKTISFNMAPAIGVMQDTRGDDQVIFTGEYTLDRSEFGIKGERWSRIKEGIAAVSNKVSIEFSMLGKRFNERNLSNFLRNPKSPPGAVFAAYKEGGLDAALKQYDTLKSERDDLNSNALNLVAYMLMKQNKDKDALAIMERNQKEFPDVSNVYDSLGSIHAKMGKMKKAKDFYNKSLELNEKNFNAVEALKHLK